MRHKPGLLWRTVRHLRPTQFWGRIWFRLSRPRPDLAAAPGLRQTEAIFQPPAQRQLSMTGPLAWRFLNEDGTLSDIGWDGEQRSKLWRYNQHYFDDLNADNAEQRAAWHQDLIDLWIAQNPPAIGSGWEPFPTSLRIVNWVKWALSGQVLSHDAQTSLANQARWLTKRLEWHLLGNHLFANAKALVYAGLYFDGPEADRWLARGMDILAGQIDAQILPDGGQFERSPMYHALAVEDMLDLVNIARTYPGKFASGPRAAALADWRRTIPGMLHWLQATSHPEGRISFFNDAAFGIAPECSDLLGYAARLGFDAPPPEGGGIADLTDSGMCRLAAGPAVVLADLAPIGPDYLPGHAHADSLSFEMSLFGQRLFVNSGTSVYGLGPERHRQRGTAAHNTVTVMDENSSEVWSGFRVGARAKVHDRQVQQNGEALIASAFHDGYRRVVKGLDHKRDIQLTNTMLTIDDHITRPAPAVARYHLHPDVNVHLDRPNGGRLTMPGGQEAIFTTTGGTMSLEPTSWHPEFGTSLKNHCIVLTFASQTASLTLRWDQ